MTSEQTPKTVTKSPTGYLDEEAVAKLLGVEPRTVRLWRRTRGLPHCKLTHKVVIFRPEDVAEWVASRRVAVSVGGVR